MKSTFFALAVAGVVAAQDIPLDIPQCALSCLATALPEAGCDGITDFGCACDNIEQITSSSLECLADNCDPDQINQVRSAASEACANVDITMTGSFTSVPASTATTTVMGTIVPDPTTTPSGSATTETDTVTSTVTTPGNTTTTTTPAGTSTTTEDSTETETNGNPEETTGSDGGDGDSGVGKPLAGLGLALIAAIAAL